jgi:hypothetical protein
LELIHEKVSGCQEPFFLTVTIPLGQSNSFTMDASGSLVQFMTPTAPELVDSCLEMRRQRLHGL